MNLQQEQELVLKAQAGDREALGALWDAFTPKLFGYLINTTRDKTLAEDLLQSTWLKAISALPQFKSRGVSLSAWLFAIARNECRQYWRKSSREETFNPAQHDREVGNNQQDDNLLVGQILSKLSFDDREIIRLRYIADLSVNDIAKVLNINFVAVRVRLHRAIARARQALI